MSPIKSLFYKPPLTKILNFNLLRFTYDCIFDLYTSMHGVTGNPLFGSSIRKVRLLIRFSIAFNVDCSEVFLTSIISLVTSAKFLGSGMKRDTSDTDSPKDGNEFFNYFTKTLNNLCKTFSIIFAESSTPFRSLCDFLIWSRILNLVFLALIFRCTCFLSLMYSIVFIIIDPSSELSSANDSSIESEIGLFSTKLGSFSNKPPSSNCVKVIMLLGCLWDDVSYGRYETTDCVASTYEYGIYVYANALDPPPAPPASNATSCK